MNGFGLRLFKPRTAGDIAQAIQFFFGVEPISRRAGSGWPTVDLDLCCQVLRVRPAVLRLRIQYEFYLRDVMFSRPFGFAMAVLPLVISRELDYFPGALGKTLASIAWLQPGITHAQLMRVAADRTNHDVADAAFRRDVEKALDYMESKYYMSVQHGWYTTGRNPLRMRRDWKLRNGREWESVGGSMHWSRLFGRDD